jgi:hypothetical protein
MEAKWGPYETEEAFPHECMGKQRMGIEPAQCANHVRYSAVIGVYEEQRTISPAL